MAVPGLARMSAGAGWHEVAGQAEPPQQRPQVSRPGPWLVMAACAAAATALSASCSGGAAGSGRARPVPPMMPSWPIA
jgi:hypothetical protein